MMAALTISVYHNIHHLRQVKSPTHLPRWGFATIVLSQSSNNRSHITKNYTKNEGSFALNYQKLHKECECVGFNVPLDT